jgi:tRNA uridine 5-carbamoylmethylation protein Kti12
LNAHREIIVAGAPTGGKSTFSHELVKKFYVQHVQIDPIIEGFEDVFPELGITHKALTLEAHREVCEKFRPFLLRVIDGLQDSDFVIEGFRMPVEALVDRYAATHQIFVFGFPSTTPEDRLELCRQFDVTNWTNDLTDEALKKTFTFLIEESRRLESLCKDRGIVFVDTSSEYWPAINAAVDCVK